MNEVLTLTEVENALRMSRSTLYRLIRNGGLPTVKIGRLVRVRREALDELIRANDGSRVRQVMDDERR